ncbi:DUF3667 domain-containing protein [Owenweeksia hongkongensis]|uniref:DUF3667 domain-containing protein n=1 Tax=Owenweeksia hongkongensis TaxID=253245 RepID=UPI003A8E4FE3
MSQELTTTQSCKNCNTEYAGVFCPACGQKLITERFTIKEGISNVIGVVFNFDRGLWPTIYGLLVRPGEVLREYVSGVTVRYFHPFRFLFLMLTISVVLMATLGINDYLQGEYATKISGHPISDPIKEMLTLMNSYSHLLIASSMPVLAFASWLFFRKKGYNYAEHLIIVSYAFGVTVFLGMLIIPVFFIDEEAYAWLSSFSILITLGYFTYVYLSLFQERQAAVFFKSLGVYLLYGFLFGLFSAGIVLAYIGYKSSTDPEFKEKFKTETKAE